ncbi:MAG: DNA internalization-related competence protein ComEC/Rec2 [Oscillospiraceae bacterium]|nr:DNA internalization-related competence protein ComEC/Rec2 [Oscillospiraceae bacterium]
MQFAPTSRYAKVFFKKQAIFTFIIFIFLGLLITIYCENKHNNLYKNISDVEIVGYIISDNNEKAYTDTYKLEVVNINNDNKFKNTKLILQIKKKDNTALNYGDLVKIKGSFELADEQRNYKGFDYRKYLKTQNIYGIVSAEYINVGILKKEGYNKFFILSNKVKNSIITQINKFLPNENGNLLKGLLIGITDEIDVQTVQNFKNTSLTHLLAVSGTQIVYIIVACLFILKKLKLNRKAISIITILIIVFFMFITGFTASVVRAGLMGIIILVAGLFFRKSDVLNNLSLSCLIMLFSNIYTLFDLGFQLSFGATLGIVLIVHMFSFKKDKRFVKYIKEGILICVSAQILILPILLYNFNNFSTYFIISNLLAAPLVLVITLFGIVVLFVSYVFLGLAQVLGQVLNLCLFLLTEVSRIFANLPGAVILVKTPFLMNVISYYLVLFTYLFCKNTKHRVLKSKCIKYKKIITVISILIIFLNTIGLIIVDNYRSGLDIHFIDVGQGDSTLIITQTNKKILIDGGGKETFGDVEDNITHTSSFEVGKDVLLPYLLDRRITCLDYIMVSHFDADHSAGLIAVLENIKVKTVVIAGQLEKTEQFDKFIAVIKEKKVGCMLVKTGDKVYVDKYTFFDIVSSTDIGISENKMNNNCIVCKLNYGKFSMLFTGDIEAPGEMELIKKYQGSEILQSTILKVAHHGSKTSSIQEILDLIKPKIAVIGVGKNNMFGHPNLDVLERIEGMRM